MYTPTVGEAISLPCGTGFQNGILPGEFVQPQGFSVGAPIVGARAVQGQRTINVGRIRCHFHLFSLNPNLLESQPGGRPGWAPLRTEETSFHSTKQAKCFRWRASVASPTLGGHKLPAKFQFVVFLPWRTLFGIVFSAYPVPLPLSFTNTRGDNCEACRTFRFCHFLVDFLTSIVYTNVTERLESFPITIRRHPTLFEEEPK